MRPDDRGSLLISAVRYALGRRTYVVSDTCRIARMALHEVTDATRAIIGRDIREALARGQCGDDIDDFLHHVQWTLANLAALDERDRAEVAIVIATVGDLDVSRRPRRRSHERGQHSLAPGGFRNDLVAQQLTDHVTDRVPLARRQHPINTRRNRVSVVAKRGQATGGDHPLVIRAPFKHFFNRLNRLRSRSA